MNGLRKLAAVVALATSSLTLGCAEMLANAAKDSYIKQQVTESPIAKPADEVWPALVGHLSKQGWAIGTADDANHKLRTADRPSSTCTNPGSKSWIEASLSPLQQGVALNIRRFTECRKTDGTVGLNLEERDWTMELEVLRAVDPQRAAAIEAEGERRKQAELKK